LPTALMGVSPMTSSLIIRVSVELRHDRDSGKIAELELKLAPYLRFGEIYGPFRGANFAREPVAWTLLVRWRSTRLCWRRR